MSPLTATFRLTIKSLCSGACCGYVWPTFLPRMVSLRSEPHDEFGWVSFSHITELYIFNGIRTSDDPSHLCRPQCLSLVHRHMQTHTQSHSLSVRTNCANTPCSQPCACVSLCARMCAYTAARQTVNKQYCLMPVCDSVCLLWVCLSLCVRICVLVWGRGSLSETETKRAFLFTLELGKVPNERLWIWWGGSLQPSSVRHTKVGCVPLTGWASASLLSRCHKLPLCGTHLCFCMHPCNTFMQYNTLVKVALWR